MRYDPTAPHPHPRRRPVTARLRLAAAALLLAALPASWADGRTRAPTAPVAVGLPHIVPVTGGSNFRDIGGYPTVDGKRVRFGLVFRSASTDYLTAADIRLVQRLGIRVFYDLRDAPERRPDRPDGVSFPPVITWPDQPSQSMDFSSGAAAERAMRDGYAHMPEAYARPIGDIFRRIAAGDTPLAYNCSAGKDRTGLTTALLLTLLGVPRDIVMRDYMVSNRTFAPPTTGGSAAVPVTALTIAPAAMAVLKGVQQDWLATAFAAIERRYGSVQNYYREGLGLSDAEVRAIRARLLEPGRGSGRS